MLRFIHGSGWVYRAATYTFCDECGVLGDLEFARKTDDSTQHEARTVRGLGSLGMTFELGLGQGTLAFMSPAEVMSFESYHCPMEPTDNLDNSITFEWSPFRFNAIHDIESVWMLSDLVNMCHLVSHPKSNLVIFHRLFCHPTSDLVKSQSY